MEKMEGRSQQFENRLKRLLAENKPVWGVGLVDPSSLCAKMTVDTGIDFLWIETEHRPYGTEAIAAVPVICRQKGCTPIIRVAGLDSQLIKKALDVGASGVIVPQINSADEARLAVQYAKYPPEGTRGVSPTWTFYLDIDWADYLPYANGETMVIVQIESLEGLRNLDEIARVPGVDVLFAGPMDLSAALGYIGQVDHPEVQAVLAEFPKRAKGLGKASGVTAAGFQGGRKAYERGYRFIMIGNILAFGKSTLQSEILQLGGLKPD